MTAELSMYPLDSDYIPPIIDFINDLRQQPGVEVLTNQMSTQLRGEFDAVHAAIQAAMRAAMQRPGRVVFSVKYLNTGLEIDRPPTLTPPGAG